MPDLAYILRHPIQEARIAWMNRTPPPALRRVAARRVLFEFQQRIVRRIAAPALPIADYTSDWTNTDVLGEDEDGYLLGPSATQIPDYWESWSLFKRGHLAAAIKSRRTGWFVFLERTDVRP